MSPYTLPLLGRLAWIDVILLGWFLLVLVSVGYVAWDAFTSLPEPGVIKWAWVLTTLYLGPVGAAFYILADKEPRPGEHERFVAPMWKQALGSTLHCVSGDAAGVIIAATVTGLLGLPMWFDMTAEYVLGFAFGLFIFQALFMKDMMGGSYRTALDVVVHSGVGVDERHDGRHVPDDGRHHDGARHARHGPPRAALLGHDVAGHRRRVPHRLPGQLVAGQQGAQARADDGPPETRHWRSAPGRDGRDAAGALGRSRLRARAWRARARWRVSDDGLHPHAEHHASTPRRTPMPPRTPVSRAGCTSWERTSRGRRSPRSAC